MDGAGTSIQAGRRCIGGLVPGRGTLKTEGDLPPSMGLYFPFAPKAGSGCNSLMGFLLFFFFMHSISTCRDWYMLNIRRHISGHTLICAGEIPICRPHNQPDQMGLICFKFFFKKMKILIWEFFHRNSPLEAWKPRVSIWWSEPKASEPNNNRIRASVALHVAWRAIPARKL